MPEKEKYEVFLRAQKTVVEQNTTKAHSADWCFVEPKNAVQAFLR